LKNGQYRDINNSDWEWWVPVGIEAVGMMLVMLDDNGGVITDLDVDGHCQEERRGEW
jgi:hypothetical protein